MSWDEYAADWDEDEDARAYARKAFRSLDRITNGRGIHLEGSRALDFGFGTGLLTEKLAPVCEKVVALDTSKAMIERLREKIVRIRLANVWTAAEDISQAVSRHPEQFRRPFDLIVCSSVCSFLNHYSATVTTLVKHLGPGGLFVQWDWENDPGASKKHGLSRSEIKNALSGAGLEAIEVDTAFEVMMGKEAMRPLVGAGQVPGVS